MTQHEFDIAGLSDVGRKRSDNQDHFLTADLRRQLVIRETDIPRRENSEMFGRQEGSLLVVADGMGGHRDGEVASRTAVEAAARYVLDMMHWLLKLSVDEEQDFVDELSDSLKSIQDKIYSKADSPDRRMGTTVTMAYILFPRMYVIHAGDSRCYMLRAGELQQLTMDHTIAQQMLDAGAIDEDAAAVSKWRHVLWNCVGGGDEPVRPEAIRCELKDGDVVMLCSDGLTGMVDDEQIGAMLSTGNSSSDIAGKLVQAANEGGGSDNISVVVCKISEQEQEDKPPSSLMDTTINELI